MTIEAIKASVDAFTEKTTTTLQANDKRIEAVEAILKRPGFGPAANDNGDIKAERDAVAVFARSGDESKLKAIQAGMSTASDPDGGYSVMPTYSTSMTKKLFDASAMRKIARVETITSGNEFVEPIDKDEVGAEWVGETQTRPETDSPQLAMLTVPAHEIYANVKLTQRLLDDAGFDIGSYIENKSVEKFSRSEGEAFVTGNGVTRPKGVLSYTAVATTDATRAWGELQFVASGAAAAVTSDGLRDLVWSVRAPYRNGASFLMNSQTANSVDKLKNGNGDYLWRDGMTTGAPPSLLGYPVYFDETMPNLEASSLSIAFGNFKIGYMIVDRLGVRFLRDPYSAKPHTYFYSYKRVGGGLANSEAIKLLKTQAS